MTVGELAQMILGEAWLKGKKPLDLTVILCENYNHNTFYELPVSPSPNLPNIRSIYLYPSLCLFEGTIVSVGRGTKQQFQVLGYPFSSIGKYKFTPVPREGAKFPKHKGKLCKGFNLSTIPLEELQAQNQINLNYLLDFYNAYPKKKPFFNEDRFFDKLAGTKNLRKQIEKGLSAEEIRATWEEGLEEFKQKRKGYLLYEDESSL